ncbi:MAG TPA: peroxiredoxin [Acidobacteriota bacterium]
MEGCGFRDRISDYENKNAQILGVSFDSQDENAAFAEKFNYPFPLLCDTNREIGMLYGACDTPAAETARRITYVIDPNGHILQVYGKVKPATHPEEILKTL